jgi:integrase
MGIFTKPAAKRGQHGFDLGAALARLSTSVEQAQDIRFGELCRAYSAAHYDGADLQLKKWIEVFGDRNAWDITASELADGLQALIEAGYKPATANRNASQIGSVYRWAISKRRIAPKGFISPTINLPRFAEGIREVTLSDGELQRLIDCAHTVKDRRFVVLVRLLAETGARRGEITGRCWADIDLEKRTILCAQTKTGVPRVLTFSQTTADLMVRVWPQQDAAALLFESRRVAGLAVNYKKHWDKITSDIGRPDLRMHDLRHHRAKKLIQSGTPVAIAAQALGHSSLILHKRYGHLEAAAIHDAVASSWGQGYD